MNRYKDYVAISFVSNSGKYNISDCLL
jgi:hypothetical protein